MVMPIERVGHFHGAFVVRDGDELGAAAHLTDEAGEARHVRLVERGVDLVKHAEGAGLDQEGRKEQGNWP